MQWVLLVRHHAPLGTSQEALQRAFHHAWQPSLEALRTEPLVRAAVHHNGVALEWLAEHQRDYLVELRGMVEAGQVELLGGGFHAPSLGNIPERDAQGQVEMMARYCESKLGAAPRGVLVSSGSWDADLPRVLLPTGMRFAVLDDGPLPGMEGEACGPWLLERHGHPLSVLCPSRQVQTARGNSVDTFWRVLEDTLRHARGPVLTVLDGEVLAHHGAGWLPAVLQRAVQHVATRLPGEVVDGDAPRGRVGSDARTAALRRRMLRVSTRLHDAVQARQRGALPAAPSVDDRLATAQRLLYAAQARDVLGFSSGAQARRAARASLLSSELILDDIAHGGPPPAVLVEQVDVDADHHPEILLTTRKVHAWVAPASGGALLTFDHRTRGLSLLEGPSFLDRFLSADVNVDDLPRTPATTDLGAARYHLVEHETWEGHAQPVVEVGLAAQTEVAGQRVVLEKRYVVTAEATAVQVSWVVGNESDAPLRCVLAPWIHVGLVSPSARRGLEPGNEVTVEEPDVGRLVLEVEHGAGIHVQPLGEDGVVLRPIFRLDLAPGASAILGAVLGLEEV
ncbi:MAG: hypothetical protein AB2A00_21860 [Myxococcota bacterium]